MSENSKIINALKTSVEDLSIDIFEKVNMVNGIFCHIRDILGIEVFQSKDTFNRWRNRECSSEEGIEHIIYVLKKIEEGNISFKSINDKQLLIELIKATITKYSNIKLDYSKDLIKGRGLY